MSLVFFVMCMDASPRGGVCRKETEMAQAAENKVAGGKRVDYVLPFFFQRDRVLQNS